MDDILKKLQELENLALLGSKEALTMNEAILLTGLSRSHLYKLTHRRKIPYFKAKEGGRNNYFSKTELTNWLLHRRIKPNDELAAEADTYVINRKK